MVGNRGVSHASHVTVASQLNRGNTCPYAEAKHALMWKHMPLCGNPTCTQCFHPSFYRPIIHQMRHQPRAAFVAAPAPAPTAEASAPAARAVGSHEAHAIASLV